MAVRYRKYYQQCKDVKCTGKKTRACPETPKKENGQYKACGVWCIEFFDDSKQWQSLTFKDVRNKTDAEKRLSLFISDRERGQLKLPKKKLIPTLAEYSQVYLGLYRNAKETTQKTKSSVINNLYRYLGNYQLDKLSSFVIEKFRIERKEKDQVKDGTINDDIAALNHILNTAIRDGILDKNPCKDVKRLKVSQTRDRILSESEIALILEQTQGKDKLMILVSLFTGLRLNDVLRLTWKDIDFAKGIITITQSKTGKLVSIPLSDYLAEELTRYGSGVQEGRIFESRDISCLIVKMYSGHFSALFKRLGIHDFTFHNLRHSFSSLLQGELGVGAVVVQGMTGHSSLGMLQKYSHTGLDNKKRAIGALTDYVLNADKRPISLVVNK